MKMKPKYRKGGYSNQTAEQYVSLQAPIYLLSEEIYNCNSDYYFSRPERNGKWLYFVGTKRK